jgi:hypothetical protein
MATPLEAAHQAIDEAIGANPDAQLIRAKCRGLMAGYDTRWRNAGWEALAVETVLQSDLFNPSTKCKSRTFTVAGKLDVIARHAGRSYVVDHKTTSQDITDPDAPFWRQLSIEGQPTHYMLLGWVNGYKFDGAMWDVVRKPGISPKKLDKATRAAVVANGTYCGTRITDADRKLIGDGEERETLGMFEARLAEDTHERHEWYFQRRMVPRLDGEIIEYAEELWDIGQEMAAVRRTGRHYRNSGSCMPFGSPCDFLGVCSGHDTTESDRWRTAETRHPELEGAVGEGLNVITNSRIRCFQSCRRRHHFKYELGLERQDAEEREALFFGTVFHLALEAWWKCFLVEENSDDDCNASSPVSGIGKHSGSAEAELAF